MAKIDEYQVTLSALSKDDGGGFLAEVLELPGCIADGETKEEALRNISDAIESWISTAKAEGRNIPEPKLYVDESPSGKFTTRVSKSLHAALIRTAEQEGVSLNHLVNTFLAMGIGCNHSFLERGKIKHGSNNEERSAINSIIVSVLEQNKTQWKHVGEKHKVVHLDAYQREAR
jgi:hypothetical protein